ncbi:unnamed protein product [Fraxinus pennsylvanica]|uniref:DUF7792 domain-containing protein n=1 Tax=Fraxinus pennsylvanica TaxID=56036 RepID=A0AAD2E1B0_9LAMI|nr:unnamed protein product [Fraxinus pennsylvanica]
MATKSSPRIPQKTLIIEEQTRIEDTLSFTILLSERIRLAVDEARLFKFDCSEVGNKVVVISQMLRSAVRYAISGGGAAAFYDRPFYRIAADVTKNLEKALTLVKKCRRGNFLCRVVTIVSAADFRKIFALLDSSVADMKWVLSIYSGDGGGGGIVITLPPIASNDPILSWVWSFIASLHFGQLQDKIEAANELASLAKDNDRNKQIIVEEGGIPPLLKLLNDNSSPEAQLAAAAALSNLSNSEERVGQIVDDLGIPIIVKGLADSPVGVQIKVANLVATMAKYSPLAQDDFARENVFRPLVTLLSCDIFPDDPMIIIGKQTFHSIVQINKEMEKNSSRLGSSVVSSKVGKRENEKLEVKLKLKISCAEALWMLARESVHNSKRISETKGLLCLAKLVETECGELQRNCLMTIMEIAAAAEYNADLRRVAFKTSSAAAKAVVEQLLRLIQESDNSWLRIPAIRAIGSLARTFPARETRVLGPLVDQLSNGNQDVAAEAACSLGKFACPDNYLCIEHCKSIIEFKGVPPLLRLLSGNERAQFHGLILLCYLGLHVGKSEALEQSRVLSVLEGADRALIAQHPELKELISKAMYHLNVYHSGVLPQGQSYTP